MLPTLVPLSPHLGYEVQGVDLAVSLAPGLRELLRGAMATRGLLVFRGQRLDEAQQLTFARAFGRISKQGPIQRSSPDVTYVSNVRPDGAFGEGELAFHSDQTYFEYPMKAIMLYGIEVPNEGGETLFSSSAVVAERMPADLRERLAGRKALARLDYGALHYGAQKRHEVEGLVAEARHPAIAVHEASQQTIHMISPDTTKEIEGYSAEEAKELIERVSRIVASDELVYRHRWRAGDLVVWDNTLLQHARSPFESSARRTLRRCAIAHEREPQLGPAAGAPQ